MSRTEIAAFLLVLVVCGPAIHATNFVISPAGGGNCTGLGGFWVSTTSTCVLLSFTLEEDDTLLVLAGATVQFNFNFFNYGTVLNQGTVRGNGTIWNYGSFSSEDTVRLNGFLVNEPGALFENEAAAELQGGPESDLVNYGEFINHGQMSLEVDESQPSESSFFNAGTVLNPGTLLGGATQTHPGSVLTNRGSFDNDFGIIRNTTVDNEAVLDGGLIDDSGGAQAFVVNRAGATINGAEITKVSIDNSGTIDNHIFGSGTIVNDAGGLIRALGGQTFLVVNDGVIDILGDFEMFNNFTNNASGILVNRGNMLSHTKLVNHGLIDNRGPWENDADDLDEGVIDNFGTLLNASSITNCGLFPDIEEVNNFGMLSNGGTITSCGTTNQGTWYECGRGEVPAGDPVVGGFDADFDQVCGALDCADDDPDSWATATEVVTLTVSRLQPDPTELSWSVPYYYGGTSPLYDLLSSSAAGDFLGSGGCVASALAANVLQDPTPDVPQTVLYFLVRAAGCGGGPAGFDSSGVPRDLPSCP